MQPPANHTFFWEGDLHLAPAVGANSASAIRPHWVQRSEQGDFGNCPENSLVVARRRSQQRQ
jgi:hypothetical protein